MSESKSVGHPINLEDFERAVYRHDYERSSVLLLQALAGFEQGTWDLVSVDSSGVSRNRKRDSAKQLLTRLCSAITAYLSDPNLVLNRQGFELLLFYKRYMVTIFAATDFVDMRHCLEFIGQRTSDSNVEYQTDADLFKVILASTATTGADLINGLIQALPAELGFLFWLSLLDNEMVLTQEADDTRNQVLEYGHRFTHILASDASIHRAVNTWMFCSYMNNPDKHKVKISLNQIIKNYCQANGAKQPFVSGVRTRKAKPVLLAICERFTSSHAMYRCYGRAIASLKDHFKLVFMGPHNKVDKATITLFDDSIVLPNAMGIKDIKTMIGKVVALSPDVIYYPSLGMESWSVGLAQYRLAPIQMMTMGHPATTYCEHIDYLFAEASTLGDVSCVHERCLHVKDGTFAMSKGSLAYEVDVQIRRQPEVLKIAVPSIAYKLNPGVLDVCKTVLDRANRPIEFHFFPNMKGVNHLAISLRLEEILPCVVHENKHYDDYMAALSDCDLALSPFPFGNTNGFIDCARLGLPVVCMDGPEAHSHTDIALSERFGLPDICRSQSLTEFVNQILRLVADDDLRVDISEALAAINVDAILYAQSDDLQCQDMVDLFTWVYQHHESIQQDPRHLWTVADRNSFEATSNTLTSDIA